MNTAFYLKKLEIAVVQRSLLFLIILSFASCRKDTIHWTNVNRIASGTDHRLNDVMFVNDSVGYICGGERYTEGDLLTTHDGGHSWQLHTFPEYDKEMFGMTMARTGTVYIIGYEGKLLYSRDAFATYHFKQMPEYKEMKGIACKATDSLIYIGGISFETGFRAVHDSFGDGIGCDTLKYELNKIKLMPSGVGYISGYGVVLKTLNDGNSWAILDVHNDNFTGMCILNEMTVFVCGTGGSVFATYDGGASWARLRNGDKLSQKRYRLQNILMLDAAHGYCVGDNGLIIYTDDGGAHWSEVDKFTDENLYGISLAQDGELLICGTGGTLYRLQR